MESNNRGITIIIIVSVIIILGVRFFLSNRETITEDDVRDKINTAVELTQTAIVTNPTRIEATSAVEVVRLTLTSEPVNSTIMAQETQIVALRATNDAQSALTPILAPTLTPTPPSAIGAIRAENTAQALQATVDAQDETIANLEATNQALSENMTPTRTPIPTMVDTPDPIVMSIDSDSNLFTAGAMGDPNMLSVAPGGDKIILGVFAPNSLTGEDDSRIERSDNGSIIISVEDGDEPLIISSENNPVVFSTELALVIFDLNTAAMNVYFADGLGNAQSTAWSPDSAKVAVGDENGQVIIWDVATSNIVQQFQVAGAVSELAWSPNGSLFAVQTAEALTLFYTNTWTEMINYSLTDGRDFAWSPTSEHLVYADGNTVHAVAMTDLYTELTLARFTHAIQLVTWSPDGQFLALVDDSDVHTIYLQVWPEKNVLYAVSGGVDVQSLAWSPDSRYIMVDGTQAQIWDVATGELRYILDSNTLIQDAQWLPNNTFIVLLADNMVLWPNPVLDVDNPTE